MYSHKHGADYTTVHYMVHVHYIVHVHVPKLMVPFLIAGHITAIMEHGTIMEHH